MSKQIIYDNEEFFEGYMKLREKEVNANNLFEIPVLFSMLPDLQGKRILDLGCGFGEQCLKYVKKGAARVVGIDISEKMLEVARKENADPKIEYIKMSMEELSRISEKFDVVISSLAFHYVEDFATVAAEVYRLLNEGGVFVFSQENPINTCHGKGSRWTKDENGKKLYVNFKNYGVEGKRESTWFVDNVVKYHRTFSTVVNNLADAGFIIERMAEPRPDEELLKKYPEYDDLFHKPDFLIVRSRKP